MSVSKSRQSLHLTNVGTLQIAVDVNRPETTVVYLNIKETGPAGQVARDALITLVLTDDERDELERMGLTRRSLAPNCRDGQDLLVGDAIGGPVRIHPPEAMSLDSLLALILYNGRLAADLASCGRRAQRTRVT